MVRRIWALVAAAACVSAVVAPAATAAKARPFSAELRIAVLPAGSANTWGGEFTSSIGRGAIVLKGFTGGKLTAHLAKGSLKGDWEVTLSDAGNGTFAYTGTGTFTRGTGIYRGATGEFTLEGTTNGDESVATATGRLAITK